jgi:O-antigen/teichoic acid export membrane protein
LRVRAWELILASFGLGVLIAAGMYVLGPFVIVRLFGAGYLESVRPAQILFLCMPLMYVHLVATTLANSLHLERQSAWLLGISALINLALNLFVIPRYGIIGAAWTTFASQAFLTLTVLWVTVSKLLKPESA